MRKRLIGAAAACAALAIAWHFRLGDRWTYRIAPDWSLFAKYVGSQTYADPKTGLLPGKDELGAYERHIFVKDAGDWPRSVVVEDRNTIRDVNTRAVTWEYVTVEKVDPKTGAWVEGPFRGDIVVFPRNVERRTYRMRGNYLKGVPLAFTRVEEIEGIETYRFAYRGPAEYTESYMGSPKFPGIPIPAGQVIRCSDDQFYFRLWVEPKTGNQVKIEEGCPSGDYFYDVATGKKLAAVDRFSGVTTGDDLAERALEVRSARRKYLWASTYFPLVLLAAAAGLLILAFRHPSGPSGS